MKPMHALTVLHGTVNVLLAGLHPKVDMVSFTGSTRAGRRHLPVLPVLPPFLIPLTRWLADSLTLALAHSLRSLFLLDPVTHLSCLRGTLLMQPVLLGPVFWLTLTYPPRPRPHPRLTHRRPVKPLRRVYCTRRCSVTTPCGCYYAS